MIELTSRSIRLNGTVPSGAVLVDGTGLGDVGAAVLRDRRHLATDGMLVVIVNISSEDGSLMAPPDIITRGFVYVKESEELMKEMKEAVADVMYDCQQQHITDWATIRSAVKSGLTACLNRRVKRVPMILPVISEI